MPESRIAHKPPTRCGILKAAAEHILKLQNRISELQQQDKECLTRNEPEITVSNDASDSQETQDSNTGSSELSDSQGEDLIIDINDLR